MISIQEMTESGVIDKTTMVFGQMNEPPGARLRVTLSGLLAEFFRDDEGRMFFYLLITFFDLPRQLKFLLF